MSGLTPYLCSVHTHATLCDGKDALQDMAAAAYAAGVKYYGVSCHSHTPIDLDVGFVLEADMEPYKEAVLALREQYAGWAWRFGQKLPFTCRVEGRFAWGGVEVQLCIDEGVIRQAAVYSDDMDFAFPPALEQALTGCAFRRDVLSENLRTVSHGMDIFTLLQQEI